MKRDYSLIGLAVGVTLPGIVVRLVSLDVAHQAPVLGIFIYGGAIVASAFLLTWGAEVAQKEISQNLALVILALIAILPEYAVDLYFAWTAAIEPAYVGYALANMTGANRLLVGVGWPAVAFLYWWKFRRRAVEMEGRRSNDIFWLLAASLYSFIIPIKGRLTLVDSLVLFGCFAGYLYCAAKVEREEPHLVGPAATIGELPRAGRRAATIGLFVFSASAIFASSEPFAESLVTGGKALGIDEFLLVQWVAPLASESPEFVVVLLLTLRGMASVGLGALISSKVNQWSLLVGAVPLTFALSHFVNNDATVLGMPLDSRQQEELVLTATQGIYALAAIVDYRFSLRDAILLLVLFIGQIGGTALLEVSGRHDLVPAFHYGISALYGTLALVYIARHRRNMPRIARQTWRPAVKLGRTYPGASGAD